MATKANKGAVVPGQRGPGVGAPVPGQAATPNYLRVYKKNPATGKYEIVTMATAKMTQQQLSDALVSPLNKSPNALSDGTHRGHPQPGNDGTAEPGLMDGSNPSAPTTASDPAAPVWDPSKAFATDPWYRQQKGELDYQRATNKGEYDSLMGVDGAKGRLWQDWESAIDSLTRGARDNTSSSNAALSGANLAGSGVARKSLSDITAAFLSDKALTDTDLARRETDATRSWTDFQTQYNTSDAALLEQAAERWRVNNQGLTPIDEKKDTSAVDAVKKTGVTAPPGKDFKKDPKTGKYTLVAEKPKKPGFHPVKPIGTVKPGTAAPIAAGGAKTFKDGQGNIRQIGTGKIIKAVR